MKMSATSGCSGPTTVTPQPTTSSLKTEKNSSSSASSPAVPATIVLATATPLTNSNVNSSVTTNNIVIGDFTNANKTSTAADVSSTNSVHQNNVQQQQPIDLAQTTTITAVSSAPGVSQQIVTGLRTTGTSSVLQLHPIGTIRSTSTANTSKNSSSTVVLTNTSSTTNIVNHSTGTGTIHSQPTSIISVNRTGPNLTILPATRVPFQPSNGSATTLQFARGTTILRPAGTPCQSGSITVTPITPISGSSIRLASATVNNGSWLQTSSNSHGGATFTPIRPIQVTGRPIRPDTKVIHIPQQGTVQHLTQLQMVDGKTAILKPNLSGTPIIRTIQTSGTSVSGSPITPSFTIRTASMPNSRANSTPSFQKVITQSPHGPQIQLVGGSKHAIQTITPIPRLTIANPACITISTSGSLNSSNTTPVVAVASKGACTANIIMSPNTVNSVPLTKIYDVPVLNILAKSQTSNSGNVTISVSNANTTSASNATNAQITASTTNSAMQSTTNTGTHQIVQIHGPLNGPGQSIGNSNMATIGLAQTIATSNFYVGQKGMNFVQTGTTIPIRPLTIDKKQELRSNTLGKGSVIAGSMILTSSANPPSSSSVGPLAISIGPHTFAHPITIANTPQQSGIITTSVTAAVGQSTTATPSSTSSATGNSNNSINVVGGQQQTLTVGGHIIATHSTQNAPSPAPSQSSTTALTISTTSFTTVPSTTSVIVTTGNAVSLTAVTVNSASTTPIPVTSPSIIVSNPPPSSSSNSSTANSTLSAAVPSPSSTSSQSKTNLSPRPSILRKRDAPTGDNVQLRAQRNLALNFSLPSSSTSSAQSSTNVATSSSTVSATISATVASAAANKENITAAGAAAVCPPTANNSISTSNNNNSSSGGLVLGKKDFQPPNEESSWQSCSSNSSSGSTTLSTTSETAEIQLQQQSLGVTIANLTSVSSSNIYNVSNGVSTAATTSTLAATTTATTLSPFNSTTLHSQNGSSYRSSSGTTPSAGGRSRLSSTSKAFNKDLDRVKGVKGKDDHVSPRKKPRKQQLPTGDPLEPASSEISFYQGKRLKKNELLDPSLFQGFPDKIVPEPSRDETPSLRICYIVKRPHFSLLESDKLTVKTRLNHFQKYSDVKPKDEKRPSLNELANQKDVFTKINGWKLQHLSSHLEEVIQSETNIVNDFNSLLEKIDAKAGPNTNIRDLNKLQELLKGNLQRCKVITDQMCEAQSQINKILEHKPNISDILSKHVNKRPTKKRERL